VNIIYYLSVYPQTKNQQDLFLEVDENLIAESFFGSLVPHVWDQLTTGVGPLNHL